MGRVRQRQGSLSREESTAGDRPGAHRRFPRSFVGAAAVSALPLLAGCAGLANRAAEYSDRTKQNMAPLSGVLGTQNTKSLMDLAGLIGATVGVVKYVSDERVGILTDAEIEQAQRVARQRGLDPSIVPVAIVRRVEITPSSTQPGGTIAFNVEYLVSAPPERESSVSVTEIWELHKGTTMLSRNDASGSQRTSGIWRTTTELTLPSSLSAGDYAAKCIVQASNAEGSISDEGKGSFIVRR